MGTLEFERRKKNAAAKRASRLRKKLASGVELAPDDAAFFQEYERNKTSRGRPVALLASPPIADVPPVEVTDAPPEPPPETPPIADVPPVDVTDAPPVEVLDGLPEDFADTEQVSKDEAEQKQKAENLALALAAKFTNWFVTVDKEVYDRGGISLGGDLIDAIVYPAALEVARKIPVAEATTEVEPEYVLGACVLFATGQRSYLRWRDDRKIEPEPEGEGEPEAEPEAEPEPEPAEPARRRASAPEPAADVGWLTGG